MKPDKFQVESLRMVIRKLSRWNLGKPGGLPVFSRNKVFLLDPNEEVPVSRALLLNNDVHHLFYSSGVRVAWHPPEEMSWQEKRLGCFLCQGTARLPEGGVVIQWSKESFLAYVVVSGADADPIAAVAAWLEACRPPGHVE